MEQNEKKKTYLEQLLQVVEKDIFKTEMKLSSAEVNLRTLKEEHRSILRELSKTELPHPSPDFKLGLFFDQEA